MARGAAAAKKSAQACTLLEGCNNAISDLLLTKEGSFGQSRHFKVSKSSLISTTSDSHQPSPGPSVASTNEPGATLPEFSSAWAAAGWSACPGARPLPWVWPERGRPDSGVAADSVSGSPRPDPAPGGPIESALNLD